MSLNFATPPDLFQQGMSLLESGRRTEAQAAFQQFLRTNPTHWHAHFFLGISFLEQHQWQSAIPTLQRCLELFPKNPQAHFALGESFRMINNSRDAVLHYDHAIALDPNCLGAYANRAAPLVLLGRIEEARQSCLTVIRMTGLQNSSPGSAPPPNPRIPWDLARIMTTAHNSLANASGKRGEMDKALHYHRIAADWSPDEPSHYSNYLLDHAYADSSPADLLAACKNFWPRYAAAITPMRHNLPTTPPNPDKPLRIGFVSADFFRHSCAFFLLGLFENFDRSQFQFFCYANVLHPDTFTDKFKSLASAWRDIRPLSDPDAAALIKSDNIDILLDLGGHTANSRLRLFAHKPAPLQIAWLGCPISTGSPHIDYRITDPIADPPGLTDTHFTEKLHRLPRPAWCFRPRAAAPAVEAPPALAGRPFTFASFNAFSKVTPAMLQLWAEILLAVPTARLLLKSMNMDEQLLRENTRRRFADLGVDPARLLFEGSLTDEAHLARYHDVDLALDTFPYNGTTTTCEALWMNVPVLTLAGNTHRTRVSASLLTAIGLTDLITDSPDHYKATAIRLANNPQQLATLRQNLRTRFEHSPLMNEPDFARHFTDALRTLWQNSCK